MSIVSVYFVKTELELLSSEIIAKSFEAKSYNILAYQTTIFDKSASPAFDAAVPFMPDQSSGYFSTHKSIEASLSLAAERIRSHHVSPKQIRIHLPRISTSKSNFSINFFKKAFPNSEVVICIIPHGLVSIDIIPLTFQKKLKFFKRRWGVNSIFFPKLKYYSPNTDLIGILDKKVICVYTFKGMEGNYPSNKVRLLEIALSRRADGDKKTAVIVGQPLLKDGFATRQSVDTITDKIHAWVKENNFDIVYYSKHPRSGQYLDFYHEDYIILEQNGAIEPTLCEMRPHAIISCYSTALAIGKSLLGDSVECISIGLNYTDTDKKAELREHFRNAGISIYD